MKTHANSLPLTILLMFMAGRSYGQEPRIDSIFVQESDSLLNVIGDFASAPTAHIYADTVELQISSATPTLLQAIIPVRGPGSAGWIRVSMNGKESNRKLLSYFHFRVFHQWWHTYSDGTTELETVENLIHLRTDLLDLGGPTPFSLTPTLASTYHIVASGNDGDRGGKYYGAHYDSTVKFTRSISVDASKRQFSFGYWAPNYYDATQISLSATVALDAQDAIVRYHYSSNPGATGDCNTGHGEYQGECIDVYAIAPTDFPTSLVSVNRGLDDQPIEPAIVTNPVSRTLAFDVTLPQSMTVRLQIIDILGHAMIALDRSLLAGVHRISVDASHLRPGTYVCRMECKTRTSSFRFVKQ